MQHTVEDISPVKKKVAVTVPAEEVAAILNRTTAQYRSRVALPGFRKGKAPMAMVEQRFTQDIYSEAVNTLVNDNISEIMQAMDVAPLGDLSFDGKNEPLKRGQDFSYVFSFEFMPEINVPEYEGIGVKEDEAVVEEKEIDDVIERIRRSMGESMPVEEKRLPRNGDVVIMDFAGTDENGEAIEGVSGEDFKVAIGDGQVIPEFETLAMTILPGETGEGKVTFPEDYGHAPLAGKVVNMKISVKALEGRTLPEVDDEFAKKASGMDSVEAMRGNIRDTYMRNRKEMVKAKAQGQLLETLLEKVDFPLPEGMVNQYTRNIIQGRIQEMSRNEKDLASLADDDFSKMKDEAKGEAEKFAKTQMFLLTVAKKENLEASPQEMNAALRQIAVRNGRDFKELQEHYTQNNLYPSLRDRIVADKAMDVIYEKAGGGAKKDEKAAMDEKQS